MPHCVRFTSIFSTSILMAKVNKSIYFLFLSNRSEIHGFYYHLKWSNYSARDMLISLLSDKSIWFYLIFYWVAILPSIAVYVLHMELNPYSPPWSGIWLKPYPMRALHILPRISMGLSIKHKLRTLDQS